MTSLIFVWFSNNGRMTASTAAAASLVREFTAIGEALKNLAHLRPIDLSDMSEVASCNLGKCPSVAQLVSGYHTFSTGRNSLRRRGNPRAGRCAMRPIARVVRAAGHVAERRDHFLLADNASVGE
jgi:hypothetical protein